MKLLDSGIVFEGKAGTSTAGCYIPSICSLSDGSVLVSYRVGSDKMAEDGNVQFSRSRDGGKSWKPPVQPFNLTFAGIKGSFWAAYVSEIEKGRLLTALFWLNRSRHQDKPHFNPETLGIVPTKTLLSESTDFGDTWSKPWELDPSPFDCPLPVENGVSRLPDGTLICFFEKYKSYEDPKPWEQAAIIKFSYDGGKTWPDYAVAARDPKGRIWYNDQRGAVLRDGRVLNFYYTFDSEQKRYVNIHRNISEDGGRTWSMPEDTGVPGQPAQPVELEDGRIVLVSVERQAARTVSARVSTDCGKSWSSEPVLTIYSRSPSGGTARGSEDFSDWSKYDFGRPQAVLLPDGDVMVVYYAGSEKRTSIYWARVGI